MIREIIKENRIIENKVADEIRKVIKFIIKKVDYKTFKELWEEAYGYESDEFYLEDKFKELNKDIGRFLLNNKGFLEVVLEKIKKTKFK